MIRKEISYEKKDLLDLIEYLKGIEIPQEFTTFLDSYYEEAPEILPVSPPRSLWAMMFHEELKGHYPTYYRALFLAPQEELPKIQSDDSVTSAIVAWRFERGLN